MAYVVENNQVEIWEGVSPRNGDSADEYREAEKVGLLLFGCGAGGFARLLISKGEPVWSQTPAPQMLHLLLGPWFAKNGTKKIRRRFPGDTCLRHTKESRGEACG